MRSALALAELLEQVTTILDGYEAAIALVVARHPDARIFATLPGAGPVTVATLVAEIGEDRARFPTVASLLAEAGLAPVTRQSGSSRRVGFRYAANHHLRATWQQWTRQTPSVNPPLSGRQLDPPVERRIVGAAVLPAAPEDAAPACAHRPDRAAVALATPPRRVVDGPRPLGEMRIAVSIHARPPRRRNQGLMSQELTSWDLTDRRQHPVRKTRWTQDDRHVAFDAATK